MPEQNFQTPFGDPKPSKNGLREGLEALRTLFVAVLALAVTLFESIATSVSEWQSKSKEDSKRLEEKRRSEEHARRIEERQAQERSKIAEEQRAEE